MDVRDVMLSAVPTVTVETPLREIAEILSKQRGTVVLVVAQDGEVLGIVTEEVLAGALSRIIKASEAPRLAAPTSLRRAS
jgi:CBS domain-containing protein